MELNDKAIQFEKVLYGFFFLFNFIALIMLFDFNSFIEVMIPADILMVALIKAERSLKMFILAKYKVEVRVKKK